MERDYVRSCFQFEECFVWFYFHLSSRRSLVSRFLLGNASGKHISTIKRFFVLLGLYKFKALERFTTFSLKFKSLSFPYP